MIEACAFGSIVIDGKTYTSDLLVYPDGRIEDSWWRNQGHILAMNDILPLVDAEPAVIVAGMGIHGRMKPEQNLEKSLMEKGIRLLSAPNREALQLYNEEKTRCRIAACFHLTC